MLTTQWVERLFLEYVNMMILQGYINMIKSKDNELRMPLVIVTGW